MELTFSNRYLVGLNFLLVAALAYFAALSVNDLIARRLPSDAPASRIAAPAPRAQFAARPRVDYDAIVQRDIFNLAPQQAAPAPAIAAKDLHIKLLGTSKLRMGRPFAIIADQQGQQALYRLGDDIPDAGRLARIEHSRIIIDRGGQRLAVPLEEGEEAASAPAASPATPVLRPERTRRPDFTGRRRRGRRSLEVQRMGPTSFEIDRSVVDAHLQNMAELFTQIRAVPNLHDGKADGFTLSEIEPGSIFQQLGLRDGDVVTSLDGQAVGDPGRAMQLLNTLRNRQSITLQVTRGGRTFDFQYEIQ